MENPLLTWQPLLRKSAVISLEQTLHGTPAGCLHGHRLRHETGEVNDIVILVAEVGLRRLEAWTTSGDVLPT